MCSFCALSKYLKLSSGDHDSLSLDIFSHRFVIQKLTSSTRINGALYHILYFTHRIASRYTFEDVRAMDPNPHDGDFQVDSAQYN
jgi:hypothetical protein